MTDRADRPKRETMSLEEATISNMWEIAALVGSWRKRYLHEAGSDEYSYRITKKEPTGSHS